MEGHFDTVVDVVIGVFLTLIGWIVKDVKDDHKELAAKHDKLEEKLQQTALNVAGDYLKRDEFNETANQMFKKLDEIQTMLYKKADK